MQTFLPMGDLDWPDCYLQSAKALDNKRLGKQRVECKQIYTALTTGKGWIHHPATKMWAGYEQSLLLYACTICLVWVERGDKDSLWDYFLNELDNYSEEPIAHPPWLPKIASSHRAALLAKNYEWYSQFGWKEEPKIDYYWPTKNGYLCAV